MRTIHHGTVDSFDNDKGVGNIQSGGESFFFHCTAIQDGSRSIMVGEKVLFAKYPGHNGQLEAGSICNTKK